MDAFAAAPACIQAALENYCATPASDGESGAMVYLLQQQNQPTLYLKCGTGNVADDITSEMVRLRWLARFLPVPHIHQFFYSADQAWLLTTALPGLSAYECLASNSTGRPQIVAALAEFLRRLHALPLAACPFNSDHSSRMAAARRNLESGQVDASDFNSNHQGWTAQAVWMEMQALLPLSFDRVVTHGDFSLGNIFLQNGEVTGCIDVGLAGAADPYQDLAILANSLDEFGSDLQAILFSACGIAHPDPRKLPKSETTSNSLNSKQWGARPWRARGSQPRCPKPDSGPEIQVCR